MTEFRVFPFYPEDAAAVRVEDVDSHILADAGLAGGEDIPVVEWEGIFIFPGRACKGIVSIRFKEWVGGGIVGDPVDRLGWPRLEYGGASVDAESSVDEGDGAPGTVVA